MDKPHKKLEAWKQAKELAVKVYQLVRVFPAVERYGLASQMTRAAVSIASNIAEGAARGGKSEFAHFVSISQGSLSELDTQLEISVRIGLLNENEAAVLFDKMERVSKLLAGLRKSLAKQ